jgi:enoyl-CoA hydratase/carnithine racemase
VSEVVPQGELMARARAIAVSLYRGTATAKANLKAAVSMPLEKAIEYERDLQTICFATEDAAEGRAAFKEKRSPVLRRR